MYRTPALARSRSVADSTVLAGNSSRHSPRGRGRRRGAGRGLPGAARGRLPIRARRAWLIPGLGSTWAERLAGSRRGRSSWPPGIAARGTRGLGLLLLALEPVAAMEMFTPGTLEVLNGTDVRLKCTFRSPVPVGPKLTVSWYFQSELKEPLESVLYYNHWVYPSKSGRFLGRLTWDGNVHKNDASVMLHNVSPKDNGTFQCHVKNPPDVDGVIGEIQLSVVLKMSFSEVHILVLTIGISCAAMFILVVVVVIWRHWRRMQQDKTREVGRSEQLKLKEGREEK